LADAQQKNLLLHDAMKKQTAAQLLKLAIAKLTSGEPECGLISALNAVNLASEQNDEESRRRALNVASALCVMSGDYADAIDYGLQAAALARILHREDAMVNALANVTLALTHIGFYEEAIDIAARVAGRYSERLDCREDVQKLLTNASNACLGAQYYAEALRFSREAIEHARDVNDEETAYVRLVNEFNSMKAAIALDLPTAVDNQFKRIGDIANAYPTPYNQCNARFAKALYGHYTDCATYAAIAEIEALLPDVQGFSTTYLDALHWLCRLATENESSDAALRLAGYRRAQVAHLQTKQTVRIRRALVAAANSEGSTGDIDLLATKRWVEQLITTPTIDERYPERITARLSLDKQRALERITVSAQVGFDLTGLSIYRIGRLANALTDEVGYTIEAARSLELAARLHPIGRSVQTASLQSGTDTPLAETPWQHTSLGAELLMANGRNAFLNLAAEIAQSQLEHWDGRGEPRALAGKEIPEAARIVAIAIAYDQLIHQGTRTHAEAVQHIKAQAGKQFDPELVAKFLPMIERLHQQHGDELDRYLAAGAPERIDAKKAYAQLRDLVPGLTLFENA
jgi:tetratricopeptide (TPR) repeat protein